MIIRKALNALYLLRHYVVTSILKYLYFGRRDNHDVFNAIYSLNYWGNRESRSGAGSTLDFTKPMVSELPALFKKFKIRSINDAPCGDFNWMKNVVSLTGVDYHGFDIVNKLIDSNDARYGNDTIRFSWHDITSKPLPKADLIICRDCLFHFSYRDTFLALNNFYSSGSEFLLTTTYKNQNERFSNKDISTGDFRLIDLFGSPYNFPKDVDARMDDWRPPENERELCLWTREQLAVVIEQWPLSLR